jgi:hypothetical protein
MSSQTSTVNFSHRNLRDVNLCAGVTWSNTICPDGTNSDGDGGSCQRHL